MTHLSWVQICTAMGCSAGLATAPLTGKVLRACAVPRTLSLAWRLGRSVLAARQAKKDPVAAAAQEDQGRVLFAGKHPVRLKSQEEFVVAILASALLI